MVKSVNVYRNINFTASVVHFFCLTLNEALFALPQAREVISAIRSIRLNAEIHKARCKIAVVIALPMHADKAFGVGILDVGTVTFVNRNAVTSCNKANYIVSGKRDTASGQTYKAVVYTPSTTTPLTAFFFRF